MWKSNIKVKIKRKIRRKIRRKSSIKLLITLMLAALTGGIVYYFSAYMTKDTYYADKNGYYNSASLDSTPPPDSIDSHSSRRVYDSFDLPAHLDDPGALSLDDIGAPSLGDTGASSLGDTGVSVKSDESDERIIKGWYVRRGKVYFFDRDTGVERNGWIYDDGAWYYLSDHELYTGWRKIRDYHCFDESGRMYVSTITPDGYYVDEYGRRIDVQEKDSKEQFVWNKDKSRLGTLSGMVIAGHPAEFYMLAIAGETSGMHNMEALAEGDNGRAYGICQFDYRYDLLSFMNTAYAKHPRLWAGFKPYLNLRAGDEELVHNEMIGRTFLAAMNADFQTAITDQLECFVKLYWNGTEAALNLAGFGLNNRSIAVSAAIFSININCGPHSRLYLERLDTDMTDEEMIRELYHLRNTVIAREKVGNRLKGTGKRYLSAEPQMALDLLYGYVTIDSHVNYGGGVEWHGNPFSNQISTIANIGSIEYKATPSELERGALDEGIQNPEMQGTEIQNQEMQGNVIQNTEVQGTVMQAPEIQGSVTQHGLTQADVIQSLDIIKILG